MFHINNKANVMAFLKFKIIQSKEEHTLETNLVDILFNVNHVVSIKPIKIILGENIIDGYWIRLTNGKKYKATSIPSELKKAFLADESQEKEVPGFTSENSLHLH